MQVIVPDIPFVIWGDLADGCSYYMQVGRHRPHKSAEDAPYKVIALAALLMLCGAAMLLVSALQFLGHYHVQPSAVRLFCFQPSA